MTVSRVLIADDEPLLREALGALIASDPALQLVGEAADGAEAVRLAVQHQPQVVVLDVKMPGGGAQAAAEIARLCPGAHIVALTAYSDRATALAMVRAGARSYLIKGASGEEILGAIHRAARNQGSLSVEVAGTMVQELADKLEQESSELRARVAQHDRVRRALEEDRVRIALQPVVDLLSGVVVGAEALLRVDAEPQRGPDAWLSDAAAAGSLGELERAALRLAVAEGARMAGDTFLSVNLTPRAALDRRALEVLDAVDPARLVIEITEHDVVEDYERLCAALADLRSRGVRVAVDDAGAGFASFRHILRLEPDIIKLDISIVQRIPSDRKARALAAALVSFAAEAGTVLLAEGIETAQQLTMLRTLGAEWGQGYLLGRPGPLPAGGAYRPPAGVQWRAARPPLRGLREKNALIELLQTAIAAGGEPTIEAALQLAVDRICAHTGWPVGHACLIAGDGSGVLLSSDIWYMSDPTSAEFRRSSEGLRFPAGVGLPGQVLASGGPVLMERLALDPHIPRHAEGRRAGLRSGFAFPISASGPPVGVLEFFSRDSALPEDSILDVLAGFGRELGRVLERKQFQRTLARREAELRQAEAVAHVGTWRWIPATGQGWFSDEFYRIAGLPTGSVATFDDFFQRVHLSDRPGVEAAMNGAASLGKTVDFTCRFIHPDGSVHPVACRVGPDGAPDGGPPALTGAVHDLTP